MYRKNLIRGFFLFSIFLLGITPGNAAGMLPYSKIKSVEFMEKGLLLYSDDWTNVNNCQVGASVILLKTDNNYDKAYALILSAYMAGKKVRGYSDNCVSVDGTTYNTIRGFKYLRIE